MKINKPQQRKLAELYARSTQRKEMSYIQFRRGVWKDYGSDLPAVIFNNMMVGIDQKGNGHS